MTVSIAVTSGKGGVGKTNCAVNLSMSLIKMDKKVVLFDADFGMANAHILLGTNPKHTAADFLRGTAELENILTDAMDRIRSPTWRRGREQTRDIRTNALDVATGA
mgnify:CR=1 FL=1